MRSSATLSRSTSRSYLGAPREVALASDLGRLIGRLQDIADFPTLMHYPALLDRMMCFVAGAGVFVPGLLDPHTEAFARLRAAYPWGAEPARASHNDPNPRNLVFDGRRLWLIDWETAFRNEPLVDLAILANEFAPTPALEAALLAGGRPGPPAAGLGARLTLMRPSSCVHRRLPLFSGFALVAINSLANYPFSAHFRWLKANAGRTVALALERPR